MFCQKHSISVTGCSLLTDPLPKVCTQCPPGGLKDHIGVRDLKEKLGIESGDTLDRVKEKFRDWRDSKRTCERCLEDEYSLMKYCPYSKICLETPDERKEEENGAGQASIGSGTFEITGFEEGRLG
jgi:hypothetical protein